MSNDDSKLKKLFNIKIAIKSGIFVYQMGKVASTSIVQSLRASGIKTTHFHRLNIRNSPYYIDINKYQRGNNFYTYLNVIIRRLIINKNIKKNKVKIITIVREPIGQMISTFFEDLDYNIFLFSKDIRNKNSDAMKAFNTDESFVKNILCYIMNDNYCINYLDNEIKETLGVDVYAYPFDKNKGYSIIKVKNADILILRYEDLLKQEDIIRNFSGCDGFVLLKKNITNDKWCKNAYQNFRNSVVFSEEQSLKLYDSKYSRHFYTDDEIDRFKNKWIFRNSQ